MEEKQMIHEIVMEKADTISEIMQNLVIRKNRARKR